jgi:hypothetical protein
METYFPELKAAFSAICDVEVDRFRHGRVLLASRLIALYRVDRAWTERRYYRSSIGPTLSKRKQPGRISLVTATVPAIDGGIEVAVPIDGRSLRRPW